jgi:predicted MFS family arabinose efflux permease
MPVWLRYALGTQASLLVGMGLGRFGYSPMIPALVQSGALGEAEAGYVGALNLGGYVIGALLTSKLRRRFHEASVLRACLVLALLSLVASILPWGFAWLAFWRLLVGVIVAVMMILGISYVTKFAPPGRVALATSIGFTGVGMGIFFSAAGLPWLLDRGLAWAWGGSAVVGAVATVLGLWAWSGAPRLEEPSNDDTKARVPVPIPLDGKKLVAAQAMFSIGLIPHSIYWVDYIVRGLGAPMSEGALQWSLVGLGALIGTVLWGRIADRVGLNIGLVAVFAALSASIILPVLIPGTAIIVFSSLVFGSQPGSSAVIASRAQQAMGAASMVPLWRWMVVSVGTAQVVGGISLVELYNRTGDYTPVFLVGGIAMALAALLCASLSKVRD